MPSSPPQPSQPGPLAVHAARALPPATPSSPDLKPHPTTLLSTRQFARAFNQLLSFDTSSVTDMSLMFYVRSAHAL